MKNFDIQLAKKYNRISEVVLSSVIYTDMTVTIANVQRERLYGIRQGLKRILLHITTDVTEIISCEYQSL